MNTQTYAQMFGFTADQAQAIHNAGFDLLDAGNAQGALDVFQGLTVINPLDYGAVVGVAAALELAGDAAAAEATYQEVLVKAPDHAFARLKLGELKMKRGDADAINELKRAATSKSPAGARAAKLLAAAANAPRRAPKG